MQTPLNANVSVVKKANIHTLFGATRSARSNTADLEADETVLSVLSFRIQAASPEELFSWNFAEFYCE